MGQNNGRKEQEFGHVLGRAGAGTEFSIKGVPYIVIRTWAVPGIMGDWLLFGYDAKRTTDKSGAERLSPYDKVKSIVVTRRVFPQDAGLFEWLHAQLVDRGWH